MRKAMLLSSAAALALAATPASAFDSVNWNWSGESETNVNVNVDASGTPELDGVVQVEEIQADVGDNTASTTVTNVTNDQPASEGGTASFEGEFTFSEDGYTDDDDDDALEFGTADNGSVTSATGVDNVAVDGEIDENDNSVDFTASVEADEVEVAPESTFDATTELPTVAASATAASNIRQIESDVATAAHDTQVAFGDFVPTDSDVPLPGDGDLDQAEVAAVYESTENESLGAVLGLLTAGSNGLISPGSNAASTNVSAIENARVDASSQAFGNVHSLTVNSEESGDEAVAVADVGQFAYLDTAATTAVSDVSVENYANLGEVDPLVDATATAIGNASTVTVDAPDVSDVGGDVTD